ncbi:Pre-mRNA splicing factor-domain-containing protein [Triangularia verruculosa]|uniref:Pre-mRNA splicing factor-domain-containing protein n=1 Tax=Triangularia verruculosa TaxID=2587418 RepID=A0AAN6XGG9_9PEZI|nr:Pre-mRNA splicing factor-domain-containing protein [Triangularia verruculosa]
MGSGDLNMKKSWHPQRSANLAATQKAEADAIAERKKLQQRLQEIEEERKKEEIQKALEAAGGKRKVDRVEWMYAGPTGQAGDAAENEAYLLGKRRIDKLLQDNEVKKLSKQATIEDVAAVPAIANPRDVAAKIREDPLLAIKRREQEAYEAMMNDPIKRRQLFASMGIEDPQPSKSKEERRHKHRSHHHRPHRHRDDDRDSERRSRRYRSSSRDRSRSPRRRDSRDDEDGRKRRRDSRDRRRQRSNSEDRERRNSRDRRDRRDSRVRRESRDRRDSRDRRGSRERKGSRDRGDGRQGKDSYDRRNNLNKRDKYDRRDNRGRRDNYDRPDRPRQEYEKRNDDQDRSAQEEERARKLAAMQEAAIDLDQTREQRLAAIEARERAEKEAEDLARQRNKRYGGDTGFTNKLHSRAAEMKIADRMERR